MCFYKIDVYIIMSFIANTELEKLGNSVQGRERSRLLY